VSRKRDRNRNESLLRNFLEVCLVLKENLEVWDLIVVVLLFLGVMVVPVIFLTVPADECDAVP